MATKDALSAKYSWHGMVETVHVAISAYEHVVETKDADNVQSSY